MNRIFIVGASSDIGCQLIQQIDTTEQVDDGDIADLNLKLEGLLETRLVAEERLSSAKDLVNDTQNELRNEEGKREKFDSISVNYLLHCLPGDFSEKGLIFSNLREVLNDGGLLFGSTILGKGVNTNIFASKLMGLYNKKGIFCNSNDEITSLEKSLKENFSNVKIEIVGCVALFSGIKQ